MIPELKVISILKKGPLTGRELYNILTDNKVPRLDDAFNDFVNELWALCVSSEKIEVRRIDNCYLRIDKELKGQRVYRLSPSIQREFMDYSAVGLKGDKRLDEKFSMMEKNMEKNNQKKWGVVKDVVNEILEKVPKKEEILADCCFLVGGDVALGMTNDLFRECESTGELVWGSDLDIIVVFSDEATDKEKKDLDDVLYKIKWDLLRGPAKEELDYVIKDLDRVKQQARMEKLDDVIASKVLYESKFLDGNKKFFEEAFKILETQGAIKELESYLDIARANREVEKKELLG